MSKPLSRLLACVLTTATVLSLWLSALLIVALQQPEDPLLRQVVASAAPVAPPASASR